VPVTARNNNPNVTDSGDERVSVRASRTASVTPIRPDLADGSRAHARYHGPQADDKTTKPSKVRDFLSPHVEEVKQAPELSWLTQQRPQTIDQIARQLIPRNETSNPAMWVGKLVARLFKLAVHAFAYTLCAATDTDKRALISLTLSALALAAALTATLVA
jgi:hypothetical protein